MTSPIIHHVSVINRDSKLSYAFYHNILGLDFILKTVNQDDMEMYHLFFGDTTGRPGTEFSVFEMKTGANKKYGTNALERNVFAVPSEESLYFWQKRLQHFDIFNCEVEDYNDTKILRFEDHDGVQLGFTPIKKSATDEYFPRTTEEIPVEHAILGIDSIHCRVRYAEATVRSFENFFGLKTKQQFKNNNYDVTILGKDEALFNQELHIFEDRTRNLEIMGSGGIQHIALNVKTDSELLSVEEKILNKNIHYSGIMNREFFKSLYYRDPNSLLIEVATETINFKKPEISGLTYEEIPLYLPEFLEERRSFIESKLH